MRILPRISAGSVVALGHFNPLIFRPDWFKDQGIVVGNDYDSVAIEIIHPDMVIFSLPWGKFQVDRDRFSIISTQEPLIRLHDFFVNCFLKLPETPISGLGINRDIHFEAGNQEACDRVGDRLAPKSIWGDFVERKGQRLGGLRSIIMEQAVPGERRLMRLDGEPGWVRVQVEPSMSVRHGIFVQVNDHHDLMRSGELSKGSAVAELVAEKFASSLAESEILVDRIMGLADESRPNTE
jgi:hypothetical protein